jgi:uncharacterized phage-associated protein
MTGFPYRSVVKSMLLEAERQGVSVSNLSLQKLLYFSHAAHLAIHDKPLIDDCFQAWKHGPVVESLYHDLKIFGPGKLSSGDFFIQHWSALDLNAGKQALDVISKVLAQLGNVPVGRLIDLSHSQSGPWSTVYQQDVTNIQIPNDSIRDFFKSRLKSAPI